jgi:hypothetical protein
MLSKHISSVSVYNKKDSPIIARRYRCIDGTYENVTWEDIKQEKVEKQKARLEFKRRSYENKFNACMVFVFHNRQIFPFGGYYATIRTLRKEWYLNWKSRDKYKGVLEKLMSLFPIHEPQLFGEDPFEDWMKGFIKQHKSNFRKREEGLALAWVKCDYRGDILDIALTKKELEGRL